MASSSSSSATPQLKNYDVFLSFRGEDTRISFTSHIHAALCRKAIKTFIDNDLERGDEISTSLLNTIKASKISIIIFSQNYASSRWCLQELEQILDCKETKQQIVIPIFYNVDPAHVRNQTGSFGEGFAGLQERFKEKPEMLKAERWKSALNEAASLSGWTIDANTNLIGNLDLRLESQIIIITRDKQALSICGVDDAYIYKVKELREKEAHQLFNQYAFRQYSPITDYMELSKKAVAYTKGLPLALKVLGCHLCSWKKEFWESVINDLENNPLDEDILKEIEAVRSISLDISKISNSNFDWRVLSKMPNLRFFRVYNSQDNQENKLKGFQHRQFFSNGLKFFMTLFGVYNSQDDHENMLKRLPSKSLVKLDIPFNKVKHWNGVQELENLKYVNLNHSEHMKELPNLSKASNLEKFILQDCKSLLKITPSSIQNLNKLDNLRLWRCSRLISVPDGIQSKTIDLFGCSNLKIAPRISSVVQELILDGTAINELPFIEHPSELVALVLPESLESLSGSICKLKLLEWLQIKNCSKLERLPVDIVDLEASEELDTYGRVSKEEPSSIFPKHGCLDLSRNDELAPLNWVLNSSSGSSSRDVDDQPALLNPVLNTPLWSSSMSELVLENCQLTKLPDCLGGFSLLKRLEVSGNNFESIPENIKKLSKLELLNISNCRSLKLLPELPMDVNVIASNCLSLQSIPHPSFLLLPHRTPRESWAKFCANNFPADKWLCANMCFPGNEIPKVLVDGEERIYEKSITPWDPYEFLYLDRCKGFELSSDHVLFDYFPARREEFLEIDWDSLDEWERDYFEKKNCKVLIKFDAGEIDVKSPIKLNANARCNDESQSYGLSPTRDWQSSGFNSLDLDVNQWLQGFHEPMVNDGTINKSGFRDDEQQ
ncbi:disease resistance-like protein DSC1 [Pistacia vera]|uniref:disease resistance-like protein DSC1 n=1 Tax=Pistacia vera TaxID=55513 RepID=UPI001263C669|nr:disease resistance-like protein DSC1 [Pistacia vera]